MVCGLITVQGIHPIMKSSLETITHNINNKKITNKNKPRAQVFLKGLYEVLGNLLQTGEC